MQLNNWNAEVSRRKMLQRIAAGTAIAWTAPVLTSLRTPAFAASPAPGGFDISFVALLLSCGGQTYRIKWDDDGGLSAPECGSSFMVDQCSDQLLQGNASVQASCPPGVSATSNPDGSVTVNLSNCTVTDFVVKCGRCCDGPNQGGEPAAGGAVSATFPRCSANQAPCG